jgi:uncharacterized protein (TIGR02001 family)
MQKKLLIAALGLFAALPVFAQEMTEHEHHSDHMLSANVGVVSDYLFRGVSQTGQRPAIQGGFDYMHSSGFYAGVWASNISWISDSGMASSASVELDTYFGFMNSFADDWTYDVGFLRYNYPGNYVAGAVKADTNEIYGSLGWKWITAKYSYSLGDTFGMNDARGSDYLELNAEYEIPDTGVTLGAHYGRQTYSGNDADAAKAAGFDPDYNDYNIRISKNFSGYVLGLTLSGTDTDKGGFYTNADGKNLGRTTAVVSLSREF